MRVWTVDPLCDARWAGIVARHPRASVFHTAGWLEALQRTYGYAPLALTTAAPDAALDNGWPFCMVRGVLSTRLVSLPFSDHCEPLVDRADDFEALSSHLADEVRAGRCRSVESRPRETPAIRPLTRSAEYVLHTLDLSPSTERIFHGFHSSSTQRAVRRAEREGLTYERGRSERLLAAFYRLLTMTRRRHGVPPPPLAWFRHLVACLGDALAIHLASKDGQPVASILTLSHRKTLVYKYGGSDARHHRLGGMPFLFWRAIEWAKGEGRETLDLGRSDLDQPGLIAFKDHLGASRSALTYFQYPAPAPARVGTGWAERVARGVFSRLPESALVMAGRALYRHFG